MKERDFQRWVIDVAQRFGWKVWHVPMPVRQIGGNQIVPDPRGRGLPDLIMLHEDPPRLIFAELKGTGGKLSTEQTEFLRLARLVMDETSTLQDDEDWPDSLTLGVYMWLPGDEGRIETILRSRVIT